MRRLLLVISLLLLAPGTVRAEEPVPSPAPTITTDVSPVDRARGALGIVAILGLAYALSEDRKAISRSVVAWGMGLQCVFAILVLRVPAGKQVMAGAGRFVEGVLACAMDGSAFVFGDKLTDPAGPVGFVFAFRVLPTVIFVSALFAVLYHLRIMQWVVKGMAIVMSRLMGASGAESLDVAASLFLGQTEAPLTIRPYLSRLTRSELLTVMTAGMAHVSGGVMAAFFSFGVEPRHILSAVVMTAPGTILLAKMLIPETGSPVTGARGLRMSPAAGPGFDGHDGETATEIGQGDANVLDAAARGTREGLQLALNIAAMLISFLALIALINKGLGYAHTSLQSILGYALAPVAWLLGVPQADCPRVGSLLGTRTVLNELIAYGDLGKLKGQLQARSFTIATFALCGFANLSSIGIQIGGIGALAPTRSGDLARLGFHALLAGTLANFLSACIAGILL